MRKAALILAVLLPVMILASSADAVRLENTDMVWSPGIHTGDLS